MGWNGDNDDFGRLIATTPESFTISLLLEKTSLLFALALPGDKTTHHHCGCGEIENQQRYDEHVPHFFESNACSMYLDVLDWVHGGLPQMSNG